jgi:lipoprotein signal peptidase
LLVTLIVVQQIVHWTSSTQAAPVSHVSMIHHTPFTTVAAPLNRGAVLSFTSEQNQAAAKEVGEMPQRQSWVF